MIGRDYELFLEVLREKVYENLKDMEIDAEKSLRGDLFLDSISFYSLLVSLEKVFQITFDKVSIDAEEFNTVGALFAYIESLKSAAL